MEKKKKQSKDLVSENVNQQERIPAPDTQEAVGERMKHLFGEEELKPRKLPRMSADKPFQIDSKSGKLLVMNAPLIGSLTSDDDKRDIVKNALRLAEADQCDAILLTGDLMYMLTQRWGSQRPYKTQVSGIRVNPKKVEAAYPDSVKKDRKYESVESRLQKGEPVFMTLGLRLEHNTDLLRDVFTDGNKKPLYNGPVYIIFGKLEDELIMFYANELLRIGLFKSKTWAQKMVMRYQSEWRKEKDSRRKAKIYKKLKDFKEWMNVFSVMSNIADESVDKAREIVTGYIIKKYEECIPNSKVISAGDSHLKTGSRLIMTTTDKMRMNSRGQMAKQLAAKTESFSKGRQPGKIPNVMIGTGLNPYLDVKFVTYQASDKPGDKRMCTIIQAPMNVDAERYRDVIRGQNILKDMITRPTRESGFESGVFTLSWHEGIATPIISFWTSDLLKNGEIFKDKESIQALVFGKKKEHKVVYCDKEGCNHSGANDIMQYESPDDPKGRLKKFHYQVKMEMLLACDAPIAMYQNDGDTTQQMNHDYQKNTHPRYLLPEQFFAAMNKIRTSRMPEAEKLKAMLKLAYEQKIYGGVLQLDEQVKGYIESLQDYREYFVKILQRAKKINLELRDRLSVIMNIAGNHNKNTYKRTGFYISDARHIIEQLRASLLAYLLEKDIKDLKLEVESQLSAPHHGPLGEGRGSVMVPGGQRYAMVLKHKQGDMNKTQKNSARRGTSEFEAGLPVINLSGDDHRGGYRVTRGIINVKTGSQQDEGSFGREIDFSEQNVFTAVYGFPVGGFTAGPVVFITLDIETVRNYALKPFPIDRNRLFRNALDE